MILCTSIWNWFLIITRRKSVAILHTKNRAHTDSNYATFPEIMPGCSIGRRSRCPRGIRRGSAAARLLESRFRTLPWAWMSVSCKYCVLSGRSFCYGPITRPEESYRVACLRVISEPQQCGSLGPLGLSSNKKKLLWAFINKLTKVRPRSHQTT